MEKREMLKRMWTFVCVAFAAVLGLPALAQAAPPTIDLALPDIVDWTQVTTVLVAYVGLAMVSVYGILLAFGVGKKLFRKLRGTA